MVDLLSDEQFGTLNWDNRLEWWGGTLALYQHPEVELYINAPCLHEGDTTITDEVRQAFKICLESEQKARQKACDQLLSIHNEHWNEDAPTSAEEFKRRLIFDTIILYPDGSAEIYFEDDDLFWGHVIIVSMTESGEFTDATIAG